MLYSSWELEFQDTWLGLIIKFKTPYGSFMSKNVLDFTDQRQSPGSKLGRNGGIHFTW